MAQDRKIKINRTLADPDIFALKKIRKRMKSQN